MNITPAFQGNYLQDNNLAIIIATALKFYPQNTMPKNKHRSVTIQSSFLIRTNLIM